MFRLLVVVLIVVTVVVVWKAFGPGALPRSRAVDPSGQAPSIKGPDDDEEFLWRLEKERFKARREKERLEQLKAEQEASKRRRRGNSDSETARPADGAAPSLGDHRATVDPAGISSKGGAGDDDTGHSDNDTKPTGNNPTGDNPTDSPQE